MIHLVHHRHQLQRQGGQMEAPSEEPNLVDIATASKRLFGSADSKYKQRLVREANLGRIRFTKIGRMIFLPQDEIERLAAGK